MRHLVLIVLMFSFAGTAFAEKCRVKNSYGRYVYIDCDSSNSRGLRSLSNIPAFGQSMMDAAGGPTPLDAVRQRNMQNQQNNIQVQQHNMQMQILQLQKERQQLELERQHFELERLKQQSIGTQDNNSSFRGGAITEIPRKTDVTVSDSTKCVGKWDEIKNCAEKLRINALTPAQRRREGK